jgi:hypothetical protein
MTTKKQIREKARRERNRKARAAIVEEKVLREVGVQSMYRVRLTKVRYADNPDTFIDFRVFQRGYDAEGEEVYHPTRRGVQMTHADFTKLVEGAFFEGLDELIKRDPR